MKFLFQKEDNPLQRGSMEEDLDELDDSDEFKSRSTSKRPQHDSQTTSRTFQSRMGQQFPETSKTSNEDEDEEEDPLDAFMASVQKDVKTKKPEIRVLTFNR